MPTETNTQDELIERKEEFEILKATLLTEYKSYEKPLQEAEDTFEEGIYKEKREKLAVQIKDLGNKLREIETLV